VEVNAVAVAIKQQENNKKRLVRRKARRNPLFASGLKCLAIATVIGGLMCYVGLYAKITQNGYYKAKLAGELKAAKMQNQYLRADMQMLSNPDRLAVAATQAGMQQSERVLVVRVAKPVALAQADTNE
jgi:cell division protein FtsL